MSKATTEATTGNVGSDSWMATAETADRNWWIVDASGQRVGRLATQIATLLRG